MITKILVVALLTAATLHFGCASYESAYPRTDAGLTEVKTVPAATRLVSTGSGDYFKGANGLFRNLFRYIQDNDVAMTVPVEAHMEPARMDFYVGSGDIAKDLADTEAVKVVTTPDRTVVSRGIRGGYSEANFNEAEEALRTWLAENDGYRPTGPAYAVYWNSPFVPWFLKRSEVHIPVEAEID